MQPSRGSIAEALRRASGTGYATDGYAEVPTGPETRLKDAAVLVPLLEVQGAWHLLFTRRTERVESHKGQVSFPGGAADEGETAVETALREAHEEIGMKPADVQVLGQLAPMITITHFRVTPVVGIVPFPYAFLIEGFEVERVFTIPLDWLAERRNYWEFSMPSPKRTLIAYHPFDGELLWGATARMTVSFLETLGILK